MPYIKQTNKEPNSKHHCDKPRDAHFDPLGGEGSIWECPEGYRRWKIVGHQGSKIWMRKTLPPHWFNRYMKRLRSMYVYE